MPSNRKPWPLPVLYGGMVVFGLLAAMHGLDFAGLIELGTVAAVLAWGRP